MLPVVSFLKDINLPLPSRPTVPYSLWSGTPLASRLQIQPSTTITGGNLAKVQQIEGGVKVQGQKEGKIVGWLLG